MVIQSNPCQKELLVMGSVLCVIVAVFFYFVGSWPLSATAFLLLSLESYMQWQSTGKTITMSQEGCTVTFLWFRKQYAWQELTVKRYADYSKTCELRSGAQEAPVYVSGAEFSIKPVHRPGWLSPATYSQFVNPMSFFFVYFQPTDFVVNDARYPTIYMVDEAVFRAKMLEWHVPMEEIAG